MFLCNPNYRGFDLAEEISETDDDRFADIVVSRNGKYLATYPYPVRFSNTVDLVKKWIDQNYRLLTDCAKI